MKSIKCYNYNVFSKEELIIEELKELQQDKRTVINWNNFKENNIFYSEEGKEYSIKYIDHINKILELRRLEDE
ncbi:hypothetical protein [uncultured Clostridium sp.]|uniref:hypothetical protein n=1 Tax=uncultured Clostridium sp. TaxID=59620 RepID=UPI00262F0B8A|nr:hypothetical protein [uncultured Clostridium sp.]